MEISEQSISLDARLIKQLHSLSQLSETLTLRLLEIEDKLSKLEKTQSTNENLLPEYCNKLLQDSEKKMQQITSLLDPQLSQTEKESNVIEMEVKEDPAKNDLECEEEAIDEIIQNSVENQIEEEVIYDERIDTEYVDDPQMPLLSA